MRCFEGGFRIVSCCSMWVLYFYWANLRSLHVECSSFGCLRQLGFHFLQVLFCQGRFQGWHLRTFATKELRFRSWDPSYAEGFCLSSQRRELSCNGCLVGECWCPARRFLQVLTFRRKSLCGCLGSSRSFASSSLRSGESLAGRCCSCPKIRCSSRAVSSRVVDLLVAVGEAMSAGSTQSFEMVMKEAWNVASRAWP